jgi:hypothetical protein
MTDKSKINQHGTDARTIARGALARTLQAHCHICDAAEPRFQRWLGRLWVKRGAGQLSVAGAKEQWTDQRTREECQELR